MISIIGFLTQIASQVFRLPSSRFLIRIAGNGLVVIVISGIGHVLLHPIGADSHEARNLAASLVNGEANLGTVPVGFKDALGYQPVLAAGAIVNPNGGCSTPGGIGPDAFSAACRAHDLGYDVLRYAEGTGSRLGPGVRFDFDRRLYSALLQTCDTATCRATATVYYTAVTINSVRQGYVAPTAEPVGPWAGLAFGVVGLATATTRRERREISEAEGFKAPIKQGH